jgi:hypothetical protein
MMTARTFVPWVEPIADELRRSRSEIAEVARAIPEIAWSRPGPDPGWSYKDLLAHLAVGDWLCQTVLRAAVGNERFDMAISAELDGRNARLIEERRVRSVQDLIAEVAAEGEETQELLARLTEEDEHRRQEDTPISLKEYLRSFPEHDSGHLAQLRTALSK